MATLIIEKICWTKTYQFTSLHSIKQLKLSSTIMSNLNYMIVDDSSCSNAHYSWNYHQLKQLFEQGFTPKHPIWTVKRGSLLLTEQKCPNQQFEKFFPAKILVLHIESKKNTWNIKHHKEVNQLPFMEKTINPGKTYWTFYISYRMNPPIDRIYDFWLSL